MTHDPSRLDAPAFERPGSCDPLHARPRQRRLLALLLVAAPACAPDNAGAGTETETETGDPPPPALEPACEPVWEFRRSLDEGIPRQLFLDVGPDASVYGLGSTGELWVGRWSSAGDLDWTKTLEVPGPEAHVIPQELRLGPSGGLFLLANTSIIESSWSGLLVRLDPDDGSELWSVTLENQRTAGLALTPEGELVVAGSSDGGVWLSKGSPADGSAIWTREDPVEIDASRWLTRVHDIAAAEDGELRVAIEWNHVEWQGDFNPQGSDGLLRYDPLGELLLVEISQTAGVWRPPLLFDGSASVYYLSYTDPDESSSSAQLESVAPKGDLEWVLDEAEWSAAPGRRESFILDYTAAGLDLAGTVRPGDPDDGWPLWTARVDPSTGALTRGCVHDAKDPDTLASVPQVLGAIASGPEGGVAIQMVHPAEDPEHSGWLWLAYFED